ncbi:hypothetical protein phiPsa267_167 [Pseudomonas phage phiPsa267]|uniref:Uncharacterized protein n=2 Tax=Otagovirus TaxID=2560197 RepID=A0A7G9V0Y1_9CAUD|nr:hypothetical protein QGX18_gp063 [Pseudomonas phage phiPsa347]YP_010767777.1 hypothetical protein QGX19_gp063 [Pseudomonas phage phiPsa267]QNN99936.1 hypothetical protein phiPsa267_167 [Pseudomonas phage phiPsa267]QNO00454.1 hypothetical protein phiPsa347_165 [Pseudomonas phage phiPsa347]
MAGLRRPPKAPSKPKAKARPPIHQRILGRSQVEIDNLDDLELELEKAYSLDLLEYDTYLDCWEALNLRREKANIGLAKATGKYVKPDKKVDIQARRVRQSRPKALSLWQKKLIFVVCFLIFIKVFC